VPGQNLKPLRYRLSFGPAAIFPQIVIIYPCREILPLLVRCN
jgi:hypothetical protein